MTTMVYKSPGDVVRKDGTSFCCKIVDDADVDAALRDGWFSTPGAAINNTVPPQRMTMPSLGVAVRARQRLCDGLHQARHREPCV